MDDALSLSVADGIGRILIRRPARRNAMSRAMWRGLSSLLRQAAEEPSLGVLLLAGEGGQFSAGADISEFADTYADAETAEAANAEIAAAVEALAAFPRPTIAAISGACVGGGVSLALACDLRVADATARFAVTPARLGLIYSHGDTLRLVRAVGAARAKELLFTGRMVGAEEAARIGLISTLAPDARAAAEALAAELAAASRPALRAIKRMVEDVAAGVPEGPAHRAAFAEAFRGADFAEGRAAFLEKRPPRFSAP
ncbi:MAG: enoyl-CoA hydratase-related protein [Acetobacteraceae bacterium]|nr:enoyl-CoA hydratase-related protein [Acetobacteraceae bacterium]